MIVQCTSSNREMIIHVLESETDARAVYHGAPGFLVTVGRFSLHRDGSLTTDNDESDVFRALSRLGLCDFPLVFEPPDCDVISYPMDRHSGQTLLNLFSIFSARQRLINQAIGSRRAFFISPELMNHLLDHPPEKIDGFLQALYGRKKEYAGIHVTPAHISLTGFLKGNPEESHIHRQLADLIMNAALSQNRIKPFTKNVRNRKYAFRIWLNSIGMIGPEYEQARQILLSRLYGRADQRRIPDRNDSIR